MSISRLHYLMRRFDQDQIAEEEFNELFSLVKQNKYQQAVEDMLLEGLYVEVGEKIDPQRLNHIVKHILQHAPPVADTKISAHRVHFLKTAWFRYAAVITLILGAGGYLWYNATQQQPVSHYTQGEKGKPVEITPIVPGSDKAILTLSNGTEQVLSQADNGLLLQSDAMMLTTPKGGQYSAVLPDGSKVWLNAASSVKFPGSFAANERRIEITGEVYIEIAKNEKAPFYVNTYRGVEVQVLGTSFNINAYPDEDNIKTTLTEGSIKIVNEKIAELLKPGQQAQIASNDAIRITDKINKDQIIAWQKGMFQFEQDNIKTIMRQIARWYDVEVEYADDISGHFVATVPRTTSLSRLLHILTLTGGVNFKIEGKKVIVKK